ncbi:MAG: MauE/DoxX family redox-associated membrane protein, partial [Longimicrobiales bacterium]
MNAAVTAVERWALRYARVAIGAAFLSAVAGRFGLWSGQFRWESFERFIQRTAELNGYAPSALVPILAWAATILETTFG